MKYRFLMIAAAAAVLASCAKSATTETNASAKKYLDAWLDVHGYADLPQIEPGIYVFEDYEPEDGELVGTADEHPYVMVNYTIETLDGTVQETSSMVRSQYLGTYNPTYYYGPTVLSRADNGQYAGVDAMLETMRVGGTRKCLLPGWTQSYTRYDDPDDYYKNVTGTNLFYTMTVTDMTDDIEKWELDSLQRYVDRTYPGTDTLVTGLYYKQLKAPDDTTTYATDDKVYIWYIGRTLDGRVFDTNIKDTATVHFLSPSNDGEAVYIGWDSDDASALTMGSDESSMITGFYTMLYHMRHHEEGVGIFYSGLGYASSGSGEKIPGYSPLEFWIKIQGTDSENGTD